MELVTKLEAAVARRYQEFNNPQESQFWPGKLARPVFCPPEYNAVAQNIIGIRKKVCQPHSFGFAQFLDLGHHYDVYTSTDHPHLVFKVRVKPEFAIHSPLIPDDYDTWFAKKQLAFEGLQGETKTVDGIDLKAVPGLAPFRFVGRTCIMERAEPFAGSKEAVIQLRTEVPAWADVEPQNMGVIDGKNVLTDLTGLKKNSPVVLCGRGHSGTRLLSQIFTANGFDLGKNVDPNTLDNKDWSSLVIPLANVLMGIGDHGKWSWPMTPTHFERLALQLSETHGDKWGWKYGENLFIVDEILKIFPGTKFINIIRDGRDVVLSGVWVKFYTDQKFLHQGRLPVDQRFYNQPMLWMESWRKYVKLGLTLAARLPNQFLSVKYEDLCLSPDATCEKISEFLGQKIEPHGIPTTDRIGKWRHETRPEYLAAFKHGEDMIQKLYG